MPQPRVHPDAAARQRAYRERQRLARERELQAKGIPAAAPVPTMPSRQRWHGLMEQARIALQAAQEEMRAYWEDRSLEWQESERGEAMSEHIEALEELAASIGELAGEYDHTHRDRALQTAAATGAGELPGQTSIFDSQEDQP